MEHWDALQNELSAQVRILPTQTAWADETRILALDVQYDGDKAYVAGDFQTLAGELLGTFVGKTLVNVPYQPGYFAFREGPVLQNFIRYWEQQTNQKADILLIDGHGIAHPRKLGVASWLGVMLQCPTVGCAKESLLHFEGELAQERGKTLPILLETETVGVALRTQNGIKPVFVSAGHLTALDSSIDLVLRLSSAYRIADTLRRADQYARQAFRQEPAKEWTDLGEF
jgi:deoxyribonuclease V